jgi:hypothetical protein
VWLEFREPKRQAVVDNKKAVTPWRVAHFLLSLGMHRISKEPTISNRKTVLQQRQQQQAQAKGPNPT